MNKLCSSAALISNQLLLFNQVSLEVMPADCAEEEECSYDQLLNGQ